MFTCKQVSESLNKENFNTLPKWKQCAIKLHIKLCVFCGKYNKQVIDHHTMCQHYKENEALLNDSRYAHESLKDARKTAIKERIRESIKPE